MLTDAKCRTATSEGYRVRKLADGRGLYLWVHADGQKYWRLRYWLAGKEKSLSLGVYPEVSLKEARVFCVVVCLCFCDNLAPAAERRAKKMRAKVATEFFFV